MSDRLKDRTDDEIIGVIKELGGELRRRRLPAVEERRNRTYAVCRECGHPFTEAQYSDLDRCPDCGCRDAVRVKGGKTTP